eukprot:13192-Eustigmatos_ZCMA.PRE.1
MPHIRDSVQGSLGETAGERCADQAYTATADAIVMTAAAETVHACGDVYNVGRIVRGMRAGQKEW